MSFNGETVLSTRVQQQVISAERSAQVVRHITSGLSVSETAEIMGITYGQALQAKNRGLRKIMSDAVDELRDVENERIDRALNAIWEKVENGDLAAIDRFVKLSALRSKLCGLDMPARKDEGERGPATTIIEVRTKE